MPDFIIAPCHQLNGNCKSAGIVCKSVTNSQTFGICDDPPPSTTPAYVTHYRPDDWIATVNNPNVKDVTFKAIDNCVPILKADGTQESRCDGFLLYDNNINFIELKDRDHKGWLVKGREQITISLEKFIDYHNAGDFNFKDAYVCNKQRPLAVIGINTEVQKFKDETANLLNNTGLLLKAERIINIK